MDDREFVKKKAWEIIERARRNGYPPIEKRTSVEINKRDSLSEFIKTQEQADFLRKQLKWLLREAEEKEQQKEK